MPLQKICNDARIGTDGHAIQTSEQFKPGPFPIESLNETQRRIVESVAEVYQIPIELAGMPTVAVTGAALGKGWKLRGAVNGRENYGNIYIIPGAPKSHGKGAAAQLAEPIIKASTRLEEDWKAREEPSLKADLAVLEAQARHLTSCLARRKDGSAKLSEHQMDQMRVDLKNAQMKMAQITPHLAAVPSYHVGNATSEALAMKFLRNDDTLFAVAYEGGDVVRVMLGKYTKNNTADVDLWLSGYSVELYQSDRILRGHVGITPCLTALIFCQPSLLYELYANAEAFERGLTARVLPFICQSPLKEDDGVKRNVSTYYIHAWEDLITGLLSKREEQSETGQYITVECSDAACEIFRDFHNESIRLRNGEFKDIEGELGRWRENACRIGLGLCIADNPAATTLTKGQAERAVKLARWGHFSGLQILQQGRLDRRQARLNKLIDLMIHYRGEATLRDLEKSHGFLATEVEALANDFPALLRLETRQNPKGGPQTRILRAMRR